VIALPFCHLILPFGDTIDYYCHPVGYSFDVIQPLLIGHLCLSQALTRAGTALPASLPDLAW
jgi:hypothetical protein